MSAHYHAGTKPGLASPPELYITHDPKRRNSIKQELFRPLLIAAGSVCVGLGVLGIFLPLLPTTPFLLLAAACYIRSSEKLYQWLISNRWVGRYIKNYREGRGVPLATKVIGIGLLWLTIGYSAFYVVDSLIIRVVLMLIAVAVTTHLVLMKTYRQQDKKGRI